MATRVNADESTILTTFRSALVDAGAFNPECVMISSDTGDDTPLQRGDRYCLLSLGSDAADQKVTAGAGKDLLLLDCVFQVAVYARLALDEPPSIHHYLLDDTFGAFGLIKSVRTTYHMLDPQLPTGEYILARPLRYRGRDKVDMLPKGPGWGRTVLYFMFSYTPDLTS